MFIQLRLLNVSVSYSILKLRFSLQEHYGLLELGWTYLHWSALHILKQIWNRN